MYRPVTHAATRSPYMDEVHSGVVSMLFAVESTIAC
jgi:hypothetical protein